MKKPYALLYKCNLTEGLLLSVCDSLAHFLNQFRIPALQKFKQSRDALNTT